MYIILPSSILSICIIYWEVSNYQCQNEISLPSSFGPLYKCYSANILLYRLSVQISTPSLPLMSRIKKSGFMYIHFYLHLLLLFYYSSCQAAFGWVVWWPIFFWFLLTFFVGRQFFYACFYLCVYSKGSVMYFFVDIYFPYVSPIL